METTTTTTTTIRSGELRALRVLLGLATMAAPLLVIFAALELATGRNATWTGDLLGTVDRGVPGVDAGAEVTWGSADFVLHHPPFWLWLATWVPGLLVGMVVSLVAWWLLGLVRGIGAGVPFSLRAVGTLRRIAALVMIAGVLVPLITSAVNALVIDASLKEPTFGITWYFLPTVAWIMVGLLIFAIAEAFRVGSRLADDVEGLV